MPRPRTTRQTTEEPTMRQRVDEAVAEGWKLLEGLDEARAKAREARDAEHEIATHDPMPTLRDTLAQKLVDAANVQDAQMEQALGTATAALDRAKTNYQQAIAKARSARDEAIAKVEAENHSALEKAEYDQNIKAAAARAEVVAAERYVAQILNDFEQYCKQVQGGIGFDLHTLIDVHS